MIVDRKFYSKIVTWSFVLRYINADEIHDVAIDLEGNIVPWELFKHRDVAVGRKEDSVHVS